MHSSCSECTLYCIRLPLLSVCLQLQADFGVRHFGTEDKITLTYLKMRQPATYVLESPLHHSGIFGPNCIVRWQHPSPYLHHNKREDVLSSSEISWLQLPTSRHVGHRASSSLSLEPYKTVFHTVWWFCSDGTALSWTIQNRQSCNVRNCPPARLPASGLDVKSHVDVEIGWLE